MSIRAVRLVWVLGLIGVAACAAGEDGASPDARPCAPVDDGNVCTTDVCRNEVAVHELVPAGTTCPIGVCDASGTCVAPTCVDGVKNGTETDVDCGGSCAPAGRCDPGEHCAIAGDCASGVCTATVCVAARCGDGVMQGAEMCDDGNDTNGDGCDDGVGDACRTTGCGNGVVTGTEGCDDGNATNGDGCDNNCTTTRCGNGVVTQGEMCDDAPPAEAGDGCSLTCQLEPGYMCMNMPSTCTTMCGDGIPAGGEMCDDAPPAEAGDGCSLTCTVEPGYFCTGTPSVCQPEVCGNGVREGGETCDQGGGNVANGDGCSSTCRTELGWVCTGTPSTCVGVCGNGTMTPGEACDDGNTLPVDGCSATCRIEPTEIEPNEDGATSTGGSNILGNDFDAAGGIAVTNANANGAIDVALGNAAVLAAIGVAGDEDVFAVTNQTATNQLVRFDTWNRALGAGVACGTTIDLGLNIVDATGARLAFNDDRSGTADQCAGLAFALTPGRTVYAHVVEYGDDAAVTAYGLQVRPTPIVCGDGQLTAAVEECDDGNQNDTDACSNQCVLVGPVTEVEPNNTLAGATASTLQVTGSTVIRGAIPTAGDLDLFRVTVATATVLRVESFVGAPGQCDVGTLDVRLLDAAGAAIIADTTGAGIGGCGALVFPVAAGTYYAQVEEAGNDAVVARYFLEVAYQADRLAESEPANTSGVNDTVATASTNLTGGTNVFVLGDHSLETDVDFFAITVPAGARIRIETIEGDRALETCESSGIDTIITLRDETGAELETDDDGGRGFCSLIDGTGTTPAFPDARNASAAQQTYYIEADTNGGPIGNRQYIYRLQVTIR